jgi:hypothetical protein
MGRPGPTLVSTLPLPARGHRLPVPARHWHRPIIGKWARGQGLARNPRFAGDRGWTPDPRQIGGGGGGGDRGFRALGQAARRNTCKGNDNFKVCLSKHVIKHTLELCQGTRWDSIYPRQFQVRIFKVRFVELEFRGCRWHGGLAACIFRALADEFPLAL